MDVSKYIHHGEPTRTSGSYRSQHHRDSSLSTRFLRTLTTSQQRGRHSASVLAASKDKEGDEYDDDNDDYRNEKNFFCRRVGFDRSLSLDDNYNNSNSPQVQVRRGSNNF